MSVWKPRVWLLYFLATRIFSAGHVKAKYSKKREEKATPTVGKSTNNVDMMSIRRGIWKKRVPSFAPASGPMRLLPLMAAILFVAISAADIGTAEGCKPPHLPPTHLPRYGSRTRREIGLLLELFGLKWSWNLSMGKMEEQKKLFITHASFFLMNRHPVLRLHEVPLLRLHATPLPNTSNHLLRVNKGQNTKYPAHVSYHPAWMIWSS